LGKVSVGGSIFFGLVAERIVGNMIAGNSLTITNSGGNFTLNSSGLTLTNPKFSVINNNAKILIDLGASDGRIFKIQKGVAGTFTDKFWINSAGDVTFSGILSAASGNFSGTVTATSGAIGSLVIDSNGLRTASGTYYFRGNGNMNWGGLNVTGALTTFAGDITGSTGTFSGSIFATDGFIGVWNIATNGLYDTYGNGQLRSFGINNYDMQLGSLVVFSSGSRYLRYDGNQFEIYIDTTLINTSILYMNGYSGRTANIGTMMFVNGILVNP
jgi:hypothetical protein